MSRASRTAIFIATAVSAAMLFLACASLGTPDPLAMPDRAEESKLVFRHGIGFYWATDEEQGFIGNTEHVYIIPKEAKFYSYGLDFEGQVPPGLRGFSFEYLKDGQIASGRVPRFIPVYGYPEKVYRIRFDEPYDDLRDGKLRHQWWRFVTPGGAYRFQFRPEDSV